MGDFYKIKLNVSLSETICKTYYLATQAQVQCHISSKEEDKEEMRYNQVAHLTQDIESESDKKTRNHHIQERQEACPLPTGDHKLQETYIKE